MLPALVMRLCKMELGCLRFLFFLAFFALVSQRQIGKLYMQDSSKSGASSSGTWLHT